MGLVLCVLEVFLPSFIIVFFGAGAIITALVSAVLGLGLQIELYFFCFSSVTFLLIFHLFLRGRYKKKSVVGGVDGLLGSEITAAREVAGGESTSMEIGGSPWRVKNVGNTTIRKGSSFRVINIDGVTLEIRGG